MLRTIKFIIRHPLTKRKPVTSILNFIGWQLISRISKKPRVYNFTINSKLWVWNGLTGATGNIYCGLHEFEDMAFTLHFLRKEDLFIDVGANIGSYTILASAEIGARTISIEPVPQTFTNLTRNIELNNVGDKVEVLNKGVASKQGVLKFTNSFDTGNHVAAADDTDFVLVDVDSLDELLINESPVLIKIDVEGFETEVLNGANNVLKSRSLKAIIIELNGSGERYGYDEDNVHLTLIQNGFKTFKYLPFERKLVESDRKTKHNTLYIRDYPFVSKRIKEAEAITVKGVTF